MNLSKFADLFENNFKNTWKFIAKNWENPGILSQWKVRTLFYTKTFEKKRKSFIWGFVLVSYYALCPVLVFELNKFFGLWNQHELFYPSVTDFAVFPLSLLCSLAYSLISLSAVPTSLCKRRLSQKTQIRMYYF